MHSGVSRMDLRWINFTVKGDARGLLVPIEAERDVPFAIQRVYTLTRLAAGAVRGAHAHRALRQVIVAIAGSCRVRLENGRSEVSVSLADPARGLALDPLVWHEMSEFSPDCVLLVLADAYYDEADYIRDYREFMRLVERTLG
jgi:dTDP-4-dehydrorhamnose 3,5-epimerase-like enzyme